MAITHFLALPQLKKFSLRLLAATVLLGVVGSGAQAQVVFDDSLQGFASNDGAAPTFVLFNPGSNIINGTVSANDEIGNTRNFYTFSIDAGEELTAINLDSISSTNDDPGFFALVTGTSAAIPADGFANLGGDLFAPSDFGSNLLAGIAGGGVSGGTGFTSIGEGDYTFVIQQTGPEETSFSLDFQVSAVPEPTSAIILVGLGIAGLARRRR